MTTKDLVELQIGKETAWGTPVTPTARLMGILDVRPRGTHDVEAIADFRGSLAPAHDAESTRKEGGMTVEGYVCLPDFVYFLDALFGEATPQGAAAPYTRDYAAPDDVEPTPRISTLVWGKSGAIYTLTGATLASLTISGNNTEPALRFSAEFIGKKLDTGTLATLSDRAVNYLRGLDLTIYIDDFGTAPGTTLLPNSETLFRFELQMNTNRALKPDLRFLEPVGYRKARWSGRLVLSLELTGTAKSIFEAHMTGTGPMKKVVRIRATRTNANGVQEQLTFDFAGYIPQTPDIGDQDGVLAVDLTLMGLVDTKTGGMGNWLKAQTKTEVATLP